MHRTSKDDLWTVDVENYGLAQLSAELEIAMKTTSGGMSRFGALATVLNKKISPNWLVFTPPYVLLLIRTFLTLEGIAGELQLRYDTLRYVALRFQQVQCSTEYIFYQHCLQYCTMALLFLFFLSHIIISAHFTSP